DLLPDPLQGLVILASFDMGLNLAHGGLGIDFGVDDARLPACRLRQTAVVVLGNETDHAAVEVAEVVRQVGIVDLGEALPAKVAVAGEGTLAQEVIAEGLRAELRDEVHRLDDIAQRLTDLFTLDVD